MYWMRFQTLVSKWVDLTKPCSLSRRPLILETREHMWGWGGGVGCSLGQGHSVGKEGGDGPHLNSKLSNS